MKQQDIEMVPGQRWLSASEAYLGLGCVREVDFRLATIDFPAAGESRTYARSGAPLIRVALSEGEVIEDRQGRKAKVSAVSEQAGLLHYKVMDEDGAERLLSEMEMNDNYRINSPQDRLLVGTIDNNVWYELRYQSWLRRAEEISSDIFGLVGPRVGLIPHQLHIAAEVATRHSPRVLLADEVGLGKTIEAGLILHRMILAGRVKRVMVVVPEALLHQWLVEMLRRFNLRFALFDQDRFAALEGENPFDSEQRILCSLEFLTSSPKVARAALEGSWDFLVVDEAHHLSWSEHETSLEYDLIEALAELAKGVLLLTATPEQLGRSGHFGRLRLLDPDRFHDYEVFLEEERSYEPVARTAAKLLQQEPLNEDETHLLTTLLGDLSGDSGMVVDRLVDRHGTGRVMFRNTRSTIHGFPLRLLQVYPLPLPEAYRDEPCGLQGWFPEQNVKGWMAFDPRLPWLIELLRKLSPEKVLLICSHPDVVLDLRKIMGKNGLHAAVFHEGMGIIERDRAAAFFADPEEGARLMICSEIGSEGRNFQFSHHLVLFDLPLEPDLLEQRIGRLDRIGQTEDIKIHLPYFENSPSETLMRWYRDGLQIFKGCAPAAGSVYQEMLEPLHQILSEGGDIDHLIEQAAARTLTLTAELDAGRDRLLELQSHHPERADALLQSIKQRDEDDGLMHYMLRYWDAYGVQHEPGMGDSTILHPGEDMLHEHFPGLSADGTTLTFDRDDALAHEDREFLTWEHPMVLGAIDALTSVELGSTAFVLMKSAGVKPGTLLLEMIHLAESIAPPELEIGRFFPPTAIRSLFDVKGRDLSHKIKPEQIRGDCLSRQHKLAKTIINSQSAILRDLMGAGAEQAERKMAGIIDAAVGRMETELTHERTRLEALAKVNPNVRSEEIDYLLTKQLLLKRHLEQSRVRLDAVRVVVFS